MRTGVFTKLAALLTRLAKLAPAGAVVLPVLALPAMAVDAEIIAAQTGPWLVAPEDGKPGCVVMLHAEPAIGGYGMSLGDACASALPAIADSAAWTFSDGELIFIDPLRKVLVHFVEQEGSPYRSTDLVPLLLVKPPAGMDHLPAPARLAGAWTMKRLPARCSAA